MMPLRPEQPRHCGARHGVSLVELMVVLAIAALLLGFAAPAMHDMIRRFQINAATSDLFGAIKLARSQAMARGRRVQLVPREPAGIDWSRGWVVFIDANGDRRPGPGEEVIASQGELPQGIAINFTFTGSSAPHYIAFNGAGRSCSDTSTMAARFGTLSLYHAGWTRRIRINMLGRARVCNPDKDGASCEGGPDAT